MKSFERQAMKTVIHIRIDTKNRSINGYHSFQVTHYDRLHHRKQTPSLFFLSCYEQYFVHIQFTDLLLLSPLFSFL